MQEIKLSLEVEDVNLILEGLGNLPFAKVYTLVGKIQEQASQQIKPAEVPRVESVSAKERASSAAA